MGGTCGTYGEEKKIK